MRYWFDTEFIEDGRTIDLISIGIVAEDGREYYAECEECDLSRAVPWVQENVLPHLTGVKTPRATIADQIVAFVREAPEFWAYYADYDWVALCQLFGRMIDLPKGWPMFCRDLKQDTGAFRLPKQETTEHHALADARWTRTAWEFLQQAKDRSMTTTTTPPRRPGGAEAMREAAAKVADKEARRYTEIIADEIALGHQPSPELEFRLESVEWIAARIRALPLPAGDTLSTGGWNYDMEKAPKDGTHVLIAVKLPQMRTPVSGSAYYRDGAEGEGAGWWRAGEGPGDYQAEVIPAEPYAWQSIPEPPPGE